MNDYIKKNYNMYKEHPKQHKNYSQKTAWSKEQGTRIDKQQDQVIEIQQRREWTVALNIWRLDISGCPLATSWKVIVLHIICINLVEVWCTAS